MPYPAEALATHRKNRHQVFHIAETITGNSNPPEFLLSHLNFCLLGWTLDYSLELQQPSRAEILNTMRDISDAANVLKSTLNDPHVHRFLNGRGGHPVRTDLYYEPFKELELRAQDVLSDPEIVTPGGKAKPGSGPARFPGGCSVKTWIAIVIFVTTEYMHTTQRAPGNTASCDAAEEAWQACGGPALRYTARDRWRKELKKATQEEWAYARRTIHNNLRFYESVIGSREEALVSTAP